MALITVAEVLDADFCDPVTLRRQVEVVGDDGIVTYQTQVIAITASVQSASGDELTMTPDASRTGGTYEVITTFPLSTATDLSMADTVLWRGCELVVISVARFGNFAGTSGHYEAVATMRTISPPAGPP